MKSSRLSRLNVTNFRGVQGRIQLPMDANVLLVYGPNGAGKTSLLSAMELALTGTIQTLEELSSEYIRHLVHQGSPAASVGVEVKTTPDSTETYQAEVTSEAVTSSQSLDPERVSFFRDRVYLAQKRLGNLLEIYERTNRQGDSPLTEFVNELLGLEEIESLIHGLHSSRDRRNARKLVPEFRNAELQVSEDESRLESIRRKVRATSEQLDQLRASLRSTLQRADLQDEFAYVHVAFEQVRSQESLQATEARLKSTRLRAAELKTLSQQLQIGGTEPREIGTTDAEIQRFRTAWDTWQTENSEALEGLLLVASQITGLESHLSVETDPSSAVQEQLEALREKVQDDEVGLAELQERRRKYTEEIDRLEQLEADLDAIERSILEVSTPPDGDLMREALHHLLPHIDGNECPVCGRDYGEVSDVPLSQALAERIDTALDGLRKLESLSERRRVALERVGASRLIVDRLGSGRLDEKQEVSASIEIGTTKGLLLRLERFAERALTGSQTLTLLRRSERARAEAVEREQRENVLMTTVAELLDRPDAYGISGEQAAQMVDARLREVESEVRDLQADADRMNDLLTSLPEFEQAERRLKSARQDHEDAAAKLARSRQRVRAMENRMLHARTIATSAESLRSDIVSEVFDDRLNAVWKDLFVRLAPKEPYTPKFVKAADGSRVRPTLAVEHRNANHPAPPGVVLSSGNLNSAALTLFLSLNLTSECQLPWLILDDPIQSMDDIHVAQFAALVGSLAYERSRQVVLAVHERALFEYLRLELMPTRSDESLITWELSRGAVGPTVVDTRRIDWRMEPSLIDPIPKQD